MSISQAAVATIVDHVTMTMLQMPSADRDEAGAPVAGPSVEAQVQLFGTRTFIMTMHFSEALAIAAAQRIFRLGTRPPSEADIDDAVGEIVNVVAGNLRSLLPGSSGHMSLPCVVRGRDYAFAVPGSHVFGHYALDIAGYAAWVNVLATDGADPPHA